MKITKIEHLQDPRSSKINEIVSEYESKGFEVVQVNTAAGKGSGLSTSFVTIVFQKEKE